MRINVHAPFEVNEYLENLILERVKKLEHFSNRIISAEVFLKLEQPNIQKPEGRIVEIQLNVPQQTLFATEESEEFEKSLAGAADKMKRQITRYKEQMNRHQQAKKGHR